MEELNSFEIKIAADGTPILDQFSEEGFIDCCLKIVERVDDDLHYNLVLRATQAGVGVGIGVSVQKGIRRGFDDEVNLIQDHVYRDAVVFRSLGKESDRLLTELAHLYGLGQIGRRMVTSFSFTGIALHQKDIDMDRESIKIKIFGYDADEDLEDNYFETFFNLDLVNGFVFWNEKNPDYRESIIRGLTADPAGKSD